MPYTIVPIITTTETCATIVSAARSLTCRDDLDSKWQLLLAEKVILLLCLPDAFSTWQIIIMDMINHLYDR